MNDFSAESRPFGADVPEPEDLHPPTPDAPPDVTIVRQNAWEPPASHDREPIIIAGSGRRGERVAPRYEEVTLSAEPSTQPDDSGHSTEAMGMTAMRQTVEVTERPTLHMPDPESAGTLEIVPEFVYTGLHCNVPGAQEVVAVRIHEIRDGASFESATPPTEDERTLIARLNGALLQVGYDLRLDLNSRLLRPEHHHFFDKPEDMARARGLEEKPEDVPAGNYDLTKGILLLRAEKTHAPTDAFELAHEIGHSLAHQEVSTGSQEGSWGVATAGYDTRELDNPLKYTNKGINEFTTDIFTDRAMSGAGMFAPGSVRHGYRYLDIIGDALIEETATAHTLSPQEVEDMLIRGSLTGDQTGLRLIGTALGDERMARLQQVTGREGWEGLHNTAQQLGLPRAAGLIERARNGQPFEIFRWRPSVVSY